MADIPVNIKGAAKSEGELKKIANGFRSIGNEAEKAGRKSNGGHGGGGHGGVISHQDAGVARIFGRTIGGAGGREFGHLAHFAAMGPGMLLAGVGIMAAVKGVEAIHAADERRAEAVNEDARMLKEFGKTLDEVNNKLKERAKSQFDKMNVYERADAIAKGGPRGAAVKAAMEVEEEQKARDKGLFSSKLGEATGDERNKMRNGNLLAAAPQLEALRVTMQEAQNKADQQSAVGRFFDNWGKGISLGSHQTDTDKLETAADAFEKASNHIVDAAAALDRSLNARAAGAPTN